MSTRSKSREPQYAEVDGEMVRLIGGASGDDDLLLETGDALLLETGDFLLLESAAPGGTVGPLRGGKLLRGILTGGRLVG